MIAVMQQVSVGSSQVEFAATGYVIDMRGFDFLHAMGFEDPGP